MVSAVADWLSSVSGLVFRLAAVLFVLLNGAVVAAIAVSRSRTLVNRITPPWLAANVVLLGAGLGVPLLAGIARTAVRALGALTGNVALGPPE